jgi:hypothetical protein
MVEELLDKFQDFDFPGVYAYEVDEAVGRKISLMVNNGEYLRQSAVDYLKEAAANYFGKSESSNVKEVVQFIKDWNPVDTPARGK